ncbi:MAG TPA: hypothetical protein VGH24_13550 [Solirubrobacteraceae bacterium]
MDPTLGGIRAEAPLRGAAAGAGAPAQGLLDATVRNRLRDALERELALATAAGDQPARQRLLASLQSAITR